MTTLVNFRLPTHLKAPFQEICRKRSTTMTTEIVRFILDYVGNTPGATNVTTWTKQESKHHAR